MTLLQQVQQRIGWRPSSVTCRQLHGRLWTRLDRQQGRLTVEGQIWVRGRPLPLPNERGRGQTSHGQLVVGAHETIGEAVYRRIERITVVPSLRSKGVGEAMLRVALDELARRGEWACLPVVPDDGPRVTAIALRLGGVLLPASPRRAHPLVLFSGAPPDPVGHR